MLDKNSTDYQYLILVDIKVYDENDKNDRNVKSVVNITIVKNIKYTSLF